MILPFSTIKKNFFLNIMIACCFYTGVIAMEKADNVQKPKQANVSSKAEVKPTQSKVNAPPPIPTALFSPSIMEVLIKLINSEKESIRCAMYRFSLKEVMQALIRAKTKKSVQSRLLLDGECLNKKEKTYPLIPHFIEAGIEVRANIPSRPYASMHHKFFIFEKNFTGSRLLVTGSFNCTWPAHKHFCENVVVIADKKTIDQFCNAFESAMQSAAPVILNKEQQPQFGLQNQAQEQEIEETPFQLLIPGAYFTPQTKDLLIKLLCDEKKGVRAACDVFTQLDVAKAWAKKKQEKQIKESCLIVDKNFNENLPHALSHLESNGVRILQNPALSLMHHKFFIFDENAENKPLLVTGSCNCTGQALVHNWEDLVVLDDPKVIVLFINEWNKIVKSAEVIQKEDLENETTRSQYVLELNGITP